MTLMGSERFQATNTQTGLYTALIVCLEPSPFFKINLSQLGKSFKELGNNCQNVEFMPTSVQFEPTWLILVFFKLARLGVRRPAGNTPLSSDKIIFWILSISISGSNFYF